MTINYKTYVLGFAFDDNGRVCLIRKNRPDWQRGRWNGVGGHVEKESTANAMEREFREETGVTISAKKWMYVGMMRCKIPEPWLVEVWTVQHADVALCKTMTDELVTRWDPAQLNKLTVIENVPALITLCQLQIQRPKDAPATFVLNY